ncbi:MAG: YaeQ family protein [Gammaproteobacteria bacterium]
MAISSTIFKCELHISDMDRNYYADHALTIARHPSENDERMMVRIVAFALLAQEGLGFGRGVSSTDEPDLWAHTDSGEIDLWVDLGQVQDKRIRQSCGKSRHVHLITYQDNAARQWWQKAQAVCAKLSNLRVTHLPDNPGKPLAALVDRNMTLNISIQDGTIWVGDDQTMIELKQESWL